MRWMRMFRWDDNMRMIKRLYPCKEMSSEETPLLLEVYEEDILYQLERRFEDYISCQAFVKYDDNNEAYFDIYFIDPATGWNRFSIHKDCRLPEEEERAFLEFVSNSYVKVDEKYFRRFMNEASEYIGGHSILNYIDSVFVLKHIYYCYHKSGPQEILFKSGLYCLADNFNFFFGVNLLADNIKELFDGLNIRILKMLNTESNVKYLYSKNEREIIREIYKKYGNYLRGAFIEESELVYLNWCIDGITEFDKQVFGFVSHLDASEELVDYMEYLEKRKTYNNPRGYEKVFANAEDMYNAIDSMEHISEAVDNEYYYDNEILMHLEKRMTSYCIRTEEYDVMVPKSVHDIIEEANIQRNCLIRYIPEYAHGFTDLLFVVSKKNRHNHITMRVVKNCIEEARGKFNRPLTKDENEFVEWYADYKNLRYKSLG